jgi:hypothetical protein
MEVTSQEPPASAYPRGFREKKDTRIFMICADVETCSMPNLRKILYRNYPSRTLLQTPNLGASLTPLASCDFRPLPRE